MPKDEENMKDRKKGKGIKREEVHTRIRDFGREK